MSEKELQLTTFCWDLDFFPAIRPYLKHGLFLSLKLLAFRRIYTGGSLDSQAFGLRLELTPLAFLAL